MEIKTQSTFEVYFEKVRGRRNRRSRNNRAKSSSGEEKKRQKKREKRRREREKESKIVFENVSWIGERRIPTGQFDWTECQCQVWLILLDIGRFLFARSPIDGRVPHGAKPFLPGAI